MPENHRDHRPGTPLGERLLIAAAARGDDTAQARLLARYEPMVRCIAGERFLRGADREDLEQIARLAIVDAARRWDPRCGASFGAFAWLCVTRRSASAVSKARAYKHEVLTAAARYDRARDASDSAAADQSGLLATADDDPVAKTVAREELRRVLVRVATLSDLERRALSLSANDYSHREIADTLQVGTRAVNNALQRARRKLAEPVLA